MSMIRFEKAAADLGVPVSALKKAIANAGGTAIDPAKLDLTKIAGYAAEGTFFLKLVDGVLTFVADGS